MQRLFCVLLLVGLIGMSWDFFTPSEARKKEGNGREVDLGIVWSGDKRLDIYIVSKNIELGAEVDLR